ncbi:LysR family transcriptional regulator [Pseudomonas asiatica]
MDLRDLTYFETIARTGHLGKAAELLHKSQPALSKSIQRLEEALGAQLFRREGRRIRLTEVGELLLQRGRQLQLSIAETEREVRDFASGQIGTIRLGCSASMAEHLLPQLASFLLERAPELRLKLSIGQDDILRESLSSGRLDAIICPLNAGDPHLLTFPILQDEAVVVASADHPVFSSLLLSASQRYANTAGFCLVMQSPPDAGSTRHSGHISCLLLRCRLKQMPFHCCRG